MKKNKKVLKSKTVTTIIKTPKPVPHQLQGTTFQPGKSGNPNGRPLGSKHRLQESFLKDLVAVWEEKGLDALMRLCKDDPSTFVKVVAMISPKEININQKNRVSEYFLAQFETEKEINEFITKIQTFGGRQNRHNRDFAEKETEIKARI